MYTTLVVVEVGVRDLRANLSAWLDRVQAGDDVIVTERGKPVARISGVDARSRYDELVAQGRITPASKPRTPIDWTKLPKLEGRPTLSDIVSQQRRERPY